MTSEEIAQKAREVIRIESKAVKDLENRIDKQFEEAVEAIYNSRGRVVLTGMGKSGLIGRKIVATLNSTGTAAFFMHPTDALHGDLGMVRKEDILILISKSGNTDELMNLVVMLKRLGVTMIGMVGNRESQIAKECDYVLDIRVEEEACPHDLAPTASTTAALVMGDALAVALLELRGFTVEDFALLHPGGSLGKRLSLKISEIMYSGNDVPVVNEDATAMKTILEITSKRLGTTAVVDKSGKLTGIVTDGDLRRALEKNPDITNLHASDLMTKNPKTIEPDFLASFAIQKMENYQANNVAVTKSTLCDMQMISL